MEETPNIAAHQASAHEAAPGQVPPGAEAAGVPENQTDKLTHLIDLVGELVIASASASLLAHRSGQTVLAEANSVVSQLVEGIRDAALQMRMVKIGATFERIQEAARSLAADLGKDVEVSLAGVDTELDKSVVEKIGEPIMALVRMAVEHSIEPAELRQTQDKPAPGMIELKAFHDSASIVIEVADDGAGLDPKALQAQAIDKGLLQPDQPQSDEDVFNLVFDLGDARLDAVKKGVAALRGVITVSSQPGAGSRYAIRLPLTLAIIDGFLTAVGRDSYVIPLDSVVECLELREEATRGHMLNLRGEVLPFIRLREFFDVDGAAPPRENVVIISASGHKAGIVVDQLLGEFQTVIKPLGSLFKHLRGIGGSTILGSGEVALILDVAALTHLASQAEEHQHAVPHHQALIHPGITEHG